MINPFFPYEVYYRIRKIMESDRMQNDYYRNTGQKIKYPYHHGFEMEGLRDIAGLGSDLFRGINNSALYEGNTKITRWLSR